MATFDMNMTRIMVAKAFSHDAHDSIGQVRKRSTIPYWVHTDAVAEKVMTVSNDEDMIIAAHLHDVLEDVAPKDKQGKFQAFNISNLFGDRVLALVVELTDQFTKKNYPNLNRKERKAMERERQLFISPEAKTIKLADIINNTSDIVAHDPDFARVYLREINDVLPYLSEGNTNLFHEAVHIVMRGFAELKMIP